MRVVMIALLVACSSPAKQPVAPTNQADRSAPPPPSDDHAELEKAQREAAQARKDADETMERVDKLAHDLEELDNKVNVAVDAVTSAQTAADRSNAKTKLEQLRKEKAEMDRKIQEEKARAAKAQRTRGQQI
nr:hypothetical protein [Deltaproteobacteria bacterium]